MHNAHAHWQKIAFLKAFPAPIVTFAHDSQSLNVKVVALITLLS